MKWHTSSYVYTNSLTVSYMYTNYTYTWKHDNTHNNYVLPYFLRHTHIYYIYIYMVSTLPNCDRFQTR